MGIPSTNGHGANGRGTISAAPAVPPPNKHQLAGKRGAAQRMTTGISKKFPPPHIRKGESPYKQNPAIKWKRAKGQTGAQADKMGDGTYNVKGRTQATLSQFSYEELGGPLPWERQPNESAQAYRQFQVYRDMPPHERSNYVVEAKLGLSRAVITRNCAVQRWVERAAAWDFHLERAKLIQTENYQIEMAARHAEIAQQMLTKTRERLLKVNLKLLGPKEIAQWLEVGVKVERLSRGLAASDAPSVLKQTNISIRTMSHKEIMLELAKEGQRSGAGAGKLLESHAAQ
jgi:hypothetical protein